MDCLILIFTLDIWVLRSPIEQHIPFSTEQIEQTDIKQMKLQMEA